MIGQRLVAWASAAAACLLIVLALGAAPVLAAINGQLSPASARPGDWVELTTVAGAGGPDVYASLAATGPLPVFLEHADAQSTALTCDTPIGELTWAGGLGTLRFQVPAVPPGTYWITATVQGACWRFGDGAGVLTLTVMPGGDGAVPLPLIGAAAAALLITAVALLLRPRPTG